MKEMFRTSCDLLLGAFGVLSVHWLRTGNFEWGSNGDTGLALWLAIVALSRANRLEVQE